MSLADALAPVRHLIKALKEAGQGLVLASHNRREVKRRELTVRHWGKAANASEHKPGGFSVGWQGPPFPGAAALENLQNRPNLPLDRVVPVWQHRTTMSGTEKQCSLTRATLSTGGRAKSRFLSLPVSSPTECVGADAALDIS